MQMLDNILCWMSCGKKVFTHTRGGNAKGYKLQNGCIPCAGIFNVTKLNYICITLGLINTISRILSHRYISKMKQDMHHPTNCTIVCTIKKLE